MKFKLFGRLKKEAPQIPAEAGMHQGGAAPAAQAPQQAVSTRPLPEERVTFLLSRGLAEPEIIKVLKDEGYSFQEIDSGITNVLKEHVSSEQSNTFEAPQESYQGEDLAPVFRPNPDEVAREEAEIRTKSAIMEEMEEIIETLIEEKFSKVLEELDIVDKRFNEVNERLRQLNERLSAFEAQEKQSDASASEKIGEVNAREESIEPRVTSLEKAFKDIIPNLVESIREMRETMASAKRREVPPQDAEIPASETESTEETAEKSSIFD